jgi:HAD superfamily hydrolase (TIGR01509 family)
MIHALIFDFDGLILDTETPEVDAWQEVYAEYGQEFPMQNWVREVVGSSVSNLDPAAHLSTLTGLKLDEAALHARTRTYRLERQAAMPAMPGVEETIKTAKHLGLKLAVASSSKHEWVDGYLRQLGLSGYFDVIKCREDVQRVKPEPDLFLAALKGLHVRADEALVFEDSPNGILAAKRAGIRAVAIPNPITAQMEIRGADLLLSSLADMPLKKIMVYFNSSSNVMIQRDPK